MSFLDSLASNIKGRLDEEIVPNSDSDELFRLYALLVLTVGANVTRRDVHNAWCAWIAQTDPTHESLVPFDQLDDETQAQDEPFVRAIKDAAREVALPAGEGPIERALFHSFDRENEREVEQRFEQYKLLVDSSERLVSRRQGVNTFFLTANGAIITAVGLLIRAGGVTSLKAAGVAILSFAAIVLCYAWASLLTSFGQLNTGKFAVINRIERTLPLGVYSAEWEALERGENPKVYSSFTKREGWVPRVLGILYIAVFAIAVVTALVTRNDVAPVQVPAAATPSVSRSLPPSDITPDTRRPQPGAGQAPGPP